MVWNKNVFISETKRDEEWHLRQTNCKTIKTNGISYLSGELQNKPASLFWGPPIVICALIYVAVQKLVGEVSVLTRINIYLVEVKEKNMPISAVYFYSVKPNLNGGFRCVNILRLHHLDICLCHSLRDFPIHANSVSNSRTKLGICDRNIRSGESAHSCC